MGMGWYLRKSPSVVQGQSPGEVWGKALNSQIIICTQSAYEKHIFEVV